MENLNMSLGDVGVWRSLLGVPIILVEVLLLRECTLDRLREVVILHECTLDRLLDAKCTWK